MTMMTWTLLATIPLYIVYRKIFRIPSHLTHIPSVPILALLVSYLTGEVEEQRIKRIIIPFAESGGYKVVLVWAFGLWFVHIVDYATGKVVMEKKELTKQPPPADMLLWQFTGTENIFTAEGDQWKKYSRVIRDGIYQSPPVDVFIHLSKQLLQQLSKQIQAHGSSRGGVVRWSDLTHRFTLDAVGLALLGYDFKALSDPNSVFVKDYHRVMAAISSPLYVVIPSLERWFPRKKVQKQVVELRKKFKTIIDYKKENIGNDLFSSLIQDPEVREIEYIDNAVVLFMGGHDTTAGSLSTLIFHLGQHEMYQSLAREEVLSLIGRDRDPIMADFKDMPILNACIRESMRHNNPSNVTIPRISDKTIVAAGYPIPPNTPIILNMCSILHQESNWPSHEDFDPTRFLENDDITQLEMQNRKGNNVSAWIPFGLGPRACPARNFALYEQRVLAVMLLRSYRWEIADGSIHRDRIQNAFSPFALSLPYDVNIRFVKL